ncbi:hypothetical protein Y032_0064g3547 [Ancylostoma ceylanicum]|uniref:RUN domain-containing protein n=1 Tax=Ancylostoma ceylanicum TaxID=53326 RepID=A0A016U1R8_9BILA|nr:hypothetical protein Y032_0064g3547 [Ancylostoma ceylanicum]
MTSHEKHKSGISKELEIVLKAAITSPYTQRDGVPSEITQNICNVIEAIFIHGLRDPFFVKGSRYAKYPEPNFWPFVSKYSHRSITTEINSLNQIRSEIGRGRAWIRIVLNQNSLEHYLQLLLRETKAINQFYGENAYLRDGEQMDKVLDLLKGLGSLPIHAAVNSSLLNTWTPSPLILAGLVDGKPLKVGVLAPRQRSSSLREASEVGLPALDFLIDERSPVKVAPIRAKERIDRKAVLSDDDGSSVYSHPSMLDRSEIPERIIFSSTPIGGNYGELPPQNFAPLIVSRRTRRPRKSSRSSSESNSKGSRSQSESASTLADGLTELGTSAHSASQTRVKQSETLDSGIESEHRDNNPGSVSSISDGKENELIRVEETHNTCKDRPENAKDVLEPILSEQPGAPETSADEPQDRCNLDIEMGVQPTEPEAELPDVFDPPADEHQAEGSVDILVRVPELDYRADSVIGTSLHDELFNAEAAPGSNSLLSRSWKKPKTSLPDLDRSGSGSAMLSSSSSPETAGCIVSFDQALRTAMEASGSTEKLNVDLDETEELLMNTDTEGDDENSSSRKASTAASEHVTAAIITIPRENGLDSQDFRCPMCRKSIGAAFSKYGVCGIDGLYYCADCMRAGGEMPIPSRVLRSWDWKQRPVSDRGRAFIEANQDTPVIRIDQHNPTLYDHVPVMKTMKTLREQLQIASMYLFNCRESIAEDFRRRVWPRDHLYNDIHAYSISDLILLHNGQLEKQVRGFLKHAVDHVMHCSLCRQKGFICEVCEAPEVIYPFETETTHRCPRCFSVLHAECASKMEDCPKCVRRAKYEIRQEASDLPLG